MTTIQYLHAWWRFWWVVAVCAVAGIALSIAVKTLSTPMFDSTSSVLVSGAPTTDTAVAYKGTVLAQQRIASYAELVRARALARDLIDELDLDLTVGQLEDRIVIDVPAETSVLHITVRDTDSAQAELIATQAAESAVRVINTLEKAPGPGSPMLRARVVGEVEAATASDALPVWRNPALWLAGGVAVGLGLAVIAYRLDSRIRDVSRARETLGAPVLGTLPLTQWRRAGIGQHDGKGWDEAVRQLRTSIYFLHPGADRCLTLAIASPHPIGPLPHIVGEVAAGLAGAGARVLMIDGDLHHSHDAPLLGADTAGSPGLAGYLTTTGAGTEGDVIRQSASGVDVLPAGITPTSPADSLHSHAFATLLQTVAHSYDFVLVMAPATSAGTDTAAIAARCDGVVVALERRGTSGRQLRAALVQFERVDAPVLGGVYLT